MSKAPVLASQNNKIFSQTSKKQAHPSKIFSPLHPLKLSSIRRKPGPHLYICYRFIYSIKLSRDGVCSVFLPWNDLQGHTLTGLWRVICHLSRFDIYGTGLCPMVVWYAVRIVHLCFFAIFVSQGHLLCLLKAYERHFLEFKFSGHSTGSPSCSSALMLIFVYCTS